MKKIIVILSLLVLVACSPIGQQARNTADALQGTIVAAQAKYHDSCIANAAQPVCQDINKGVSGENALITAIETYCGWSVTAPPSDPSAKCVPVSSAQAGLSVAISNAAALTLEIKGVL